MNPPPGEAIRRHSAVWAQKLRARRNRIAGSIEPVVEGKLSRMVGLTLEAVGCRSAIGGRCLVKSALGRTIEAEVVGFSGERLFLMPTGAIHGLEQDCRVIPTGATYAARVGPALLGRVVDGAGFALDGKGPLPYEQEWPLNGT
ncbi:MAG: flagellum-specific ATP synthase FliI, partial [Gammaproteobacteria bacterium]